jgi:hypothetical protein
LGQVISDTRSHDAAADDDYVCRFHAQPKVRRKRKKVKNDYFGFAILCDFAT